MWVWLFLHQKWVDKYYRSRRVKHILLLRLISFLSWKLGMLFSIHACSHCLYYMQQINVIFFPEPRVYSNLGIWENLSVRKQAKTFSKICAPLLRSQRVAPAVMDEELSPLEYLLPSGASFQTSVLSVQKHTHMHSVNKIALKSSRPFCLHRNWNPPLLPSPEWLLTRPEWQHIGPSQLSPKMLQGSTWTKTHIQIFNRKITPIKRFFPMLTFRAKMRQH